MTFELRLAAPRHGWLPIKLGIGNERFEFPASHVLNDPLRDLADLASFLANGYIGTVAVPFWLEPDGYELSATRERTVAPTVTLALHYGKEAYPRLDDPTLVTSCEADPHQVCEAIMMALRDVRPSYSAEHWGYPFPSLEG